MSRRMEEKLTLRGFSDFVIMKDRETEHFNYFSTDLDNDRDIKQFMHGKFILSMKEIQKLLNNEYLNEIEFSEGDKARFDVIFDIEINKQSRYELTSEYSVRLSTVILEDDDSYIKNLIEDVLNLRENLDRINDLSYDLFKEEQPIEIKFMSDNDDQSNSKIMKMIKRYNDHKSDKRH